MYHEIIETKYLLTTAILQVESLHDKLTKEEQARKVLEEEKRLQDLKTTQAILKAQKEHGNIQVSGCFGLRVCKWNCQLSFHPTASFRYIYIY